MARSIIPASGERAIIFGQTGSGKTAFGIWLVERIPDAPLIIYDTKIEPKFDRLGEYTVTDENGHKKVVRPVAVVQHTEEIHDLLHDDSIDYIIVRPPDELLGEPRALDEYLWYHYQNCKGVPAFIDEAVTFQINNRAGKGLIALMQRGRSKGITTIMCSQRPVRIDRSLLTEANKIYIFYMADKADRKRVDDLISNFSDLPRPPKHGFYFFESGSEEVELMQPIKLDASKDTGYVDTSAPAGQSDGGENSGNLSNPGRHVWL